MLFENTTIEGLILITPELTVDDRGLFARTFSSSQFRDQNLHCNFTESGLSYNPVKGTLRGLHFQKEPATEIKLVRCSRGAIFDVVIDLRKESPSYKLCFSMVLTAENRKMLYVPPGCAHGFITLKDESEVTYQVQDQCDHELLQVLRWDDPRFNITWPIEPAIISEGDQISSPLDC